MAFDLQTHPMRLVREQTANCIKDLNALRTEVSSGLLATRIQRIWGNHIEPTPCNLVFAGASEKNDFCCNFAFTLA